jgi:hypothetical protein
MIMEGRKEGSRDEDKDEYSEGRSSSQSVS